MDDIQIYSPDLIKINDRVGILPSVPDNTEISSDALTDDEVTNINTRLDQLSQNTKIDAILPSGRIVQGEEPILQHKEVILKVDTDSYLGNIIRAFK